MILLDEESIFTLLKDKKWLKSPKLQPLAIYSYLIKYINIEAHVVSTVYGLPDFVNVV